MPATAALFAELRQSLGKDLVDGLVRRAAAGQPGVYVAELGRDGVQREFGRLASGRRCVLARGDRPGEVRAQWVDRHGRPVLDPMEWALVHGVVPAVRMGSPAPALAALQRRDRQQGGGR